MRCEPDNFSMSWFYKHLIRPALFNNDAETIHARTMHSLSKLGRSAHACDVMESFLAPTALPVNVFGLRFPNPIGLAAGMDKCGEAVPVWAAMGFGFAELGGVTWLAQPGNPKPRIFRVVAEEAIVNRMGFNNEGAEALANKLKHWRALGRWPNHPVGINLGKSKVTPLEQAAEDYANSFRALRDLADFFVVNVSSPNTPNLRQLQDKAALDEILSAIQEINASDTKTRREPLPILVKVAPDLTFEVLDEILELVAPRNIAGIVATNTTISRPQSADTTAQKVYAEMGGLSGRPVRASSTEVIRHLHRQTRGRLPIIGVGGIFNADDAWEKITAGASLLQIYTGLVYEGPTIVRAIVVGLQRKLSEAGMTHLSQAVGTRA